MTTDSQKAAARAYYLRNREARLIKMRERARTRAEEARQKAAADKEFAEKQKEATAEKYAARVARIQRKQIENWDADPGISPTFKAFLKSCVAPAIENHISPVLFTLLNKLPLAVKSQDNIAPPLQNASTQTD